MKKQLAFLFFAFTALLVGASCSLAQDAMPKVYFTEDISAHGIMKAYQALGRPATGKVAIKLHMGEPGNKYYVDPELIKELVLSTKGSFVDGNTWYGGLRTHTAAHLQAAKDHGFTYAPVDILDSQGEIRLPIRGGKRLKEAVLGSHYRDYDFIISIAHFKGHGVAGFGGTFKNLAIGMASVSGKSSIHRESLTASRYSSSGESFFEKVAEYTKAVVDDRGDKIVYINILNNLSIRCDCSAESPHPEMADIGIVASLDPVAIDKASVDLVYSSPDEGKKHLIERMESRNAVYLLDYAEKLGIGGQKYELVRLDN